MARKTAEYKQARYGSKGRDRRLVLRMALKERERIKELARALDQSATHFVVDAINAHARALGMQVGDVIKVETRAGE